MVQIVPKRSTKCCNLSTVVCLLWPMRRVIVFGKCKEPCKGLLGATRKFEAARFGHLLTSGNSRYILVPNSETTLYRGLVLIWSLKGGRRDRKVTFKLTDSGKTGTGGI